jgi:hypothetical protein
MTRRWAWMLFALELTVCATALRGRPAVADEPNRLRILSSKSIQGEAAAEELPPGAEPRPLPPAEAWDLKPIGAVTLDTQAPAGDFPENVAAPYMEAAGEYTDQPNLEAAGWSYAYYWQASGYCHGPLYFEEVNLERYGYNCGVLQPAASAAHFFGTLPFLPYKMAVDRPGTCIYTLGHERPGSYTPFRIHRPPLRWDAALVEGAAVTGLIFLIP